ncbi:alpha/beta fold hydrolase [Bordetella pseudohinzii]|uniref:Acetoin dehydrogenase E2 subunit dihydrolipoyllysine-residue acetyltransferase n=1 Tax=Bordetella pseudohinzii TaxID=1331258 RepID=A0A0J6F1X8_9BORD|nr:alpha/beta hydrolase [Bordetella pseudohinzii]ANY17865.1 hydrolase [Bordetella pseudohinzii]KMM26495.1 hydrolase [Bordetella pseudohinzii]KXA77029.1 hydrolase [Bordetella pseudohinzii]KXA80090.1 hydrolase [Bordetella pseudohinzii]CUI78216.1 acetoin dehydrogenase E2 subunit dihydrolipoyllysine-residue acetyltransferase [Bordetella pseudohinzii]
MTLMKDVYTGRVSAGDVPVTYYDSAPGAAEAKTIVLLHGTGGSAENNFWALFPMLAMRHRVVALDFVDPETPGAQAYLDQVQAVVQALDGPVHLVGYSFGAVIGALYAARHGGQLASLTLVAGWLKTDAQQRLRNDIWRSLYESGHDALAPFSVFTNFSQAFLNAKNDAELDALIQGVRTGPDRSRKMAFNRDVDIGAEAAAIAVPSLVIACTQDQMAPLRHSRLLFGSIKNCRYAEIHAGHGVVHERPSELFIMIDSFVRQPDGWPAGHVVQNSHA